MGSLSAFAELRRTLNASLDEIENQLKLQNQPDLGLLDLHPTDDPGFIPTKEFFRARNQAIGCLGQLKECIQSPAERLMIASLIAHLPAALQTIIEADIPDLLPADKQGVPVEELAEICAMNDKKLNKLMRYLAGQSIFREVKEGVYAHSRASLLLRNGVPIRDFVGYQTWHALSVSPFQSSVYRSPETRDQWTPTTSPAAIAKNFGGKGYADLWEYLAAEHPNRVKQFGRAMTALGSVSARGTIADYPWDQLPKNSKIIDVGGGEGALLIEIMRSFPDRFTGVLQDRPEVVPLAKANFEKNLPEAVSRVEFQPYNFFEEQPQKGSNRVFVLRWIIHDHADELSLRILTRLREAGDRDTRIIINDTIMLPATPADIISDTGALFQPPLLTSGGQATELQSMVDLEMMQTVAAFERTEAEFKALLEKAGLVCKAVYHVRGPHGIIEAGLP